MPIEVAPVTPAHIPELAEICFHAFGTLQDRHGVERDFDRVETAAMVVGLFASRPDFAGFAAVDRTPGVEGRLLGSNFISFSDPVAGVGPITVRPEAQCRGVGRALMQAVMEEARRRGVQQVRLLQETINTTSLSLYTKLGFDWQDGVALMRPKPAAVDDPRMRPVTERDLGEIDRLSRRHYHVTRVNEVAGFLKIGIPGFLLNGGGGATGYYFPSFIGHGFAPSAAELAALITHAVRHCPPEFHKVLVPLSENDLHRALLERGTRTIKLFSYMTTGEFKRPNGAWVPSIGM